MDRLHWKLYSVQRGARALGESILWAVVAVAVSQASWVLTREGARCGATLGVDEPGIICDAYFNLIASTFFIAGAAILLVFPLTLTLDLLNARGLRRRAGLIGVITAVVVACLIVFDMANQYVSLHAFGQSRRTLSDILLDECSLVVAAFVMLQPAWRRSFTVTV